ncbi:SDR family NAD(P)-dependent oxidoreductase [Streptomyces sp. NPDC001663]|uniref:SDR family NAD(P)-dependent oxidoreductase n=1 Tax=Streptomyces sp. NPDC001663 TaxID=3364597 RepID=UPI00369AD16B
MDVKPLVGKKAVVTGAAAGIGKATAGVLAEAGASVVAVDIAPQTSSDAVLSVIKAAGGQGHYVRANLSSAAECHEALARAAERLGGLDILVSVAGGARVRNAGDTYEMGHAPFADITEAEYDEIVDSNLKSAFFCAQAAAKVMLEQGGGRIVLFGSSSAYHGQPGLPHYSAAKAGVVTLARTLAVELAPTITVNTVCPGGVATESMLNSVENTEGRFDGIPLGRWATPQEVARAALFLVSPDGDYFTGQTLDPNGGLTAP